MRPKLAESPGESLSTSGWLIWRRPPKPSVTLPETRIVSPAANWRMRQGGGLKKTRSSRPLASESSTFSMGLPLRMRAGRVARTCPRAMPSSPTRRSPRRRATVRSWYALGQNESACSTVRWPRSSSSARGAGWARGTSASFWRSRARRACRSARVVGSGGSGGSGSAARAIVVVAGSWSSQMARSGAAGFVPLPPLAFQGEGDGTLGIAVAGFLASTLPLAASSRRSSGTGMSVERFPATRASTRFLYGAGSRSNPSASAASARSAAESGAPAARARTTAPRSSSSKAVSRGSAANPSRTANRSGGTRAARWCAASAASPPPGGRLPPTPAGTSNPSRLRPVGRELLLDELDRVDLVLALAAGRRELHDVALLLADHGPGDRRGDADLPLLQVGLELAHHLVAHLVARLGVGDGDGGAEDDAVALQLADLDHLGARDPVLDLEEAALEVRLLVLGGVVLRVLGEIAVGARLRDLPHDLGALDRLQPLQLFLEPREPGLGDGHASRGHGLPSEEKNRGRPLGAAAGVDRASARVGCQPGVTPERGGTPGASEPRGARPSQPRSRRRPRGRRSGW